MARKRPLPDPHVALPNENEDLQDQEFFDNQEIRGARRLQPEAIENEEPDVDPPEINQDYEPVENRPTGNTLEEDWREHFELAFVVDSEPRSEREALSRSDASQWQAAMDEEMASLMEHGTWKKLDCPVTSTPITMKWVYALKRNEFNQPIRYKARLVARGDKQRAGIDYDETFSPTVRLESQRLMLAEAARNDWHIHQIDIQTAFLNSDLNKEGDPLFLRKPDGEIVIAVKGMYGLKQASRCWYGTLNTVLKGINLQSTLRDDSVFVRDRDDPENKVIMTVHVDDITIASKKLGTVEGIKQKLAATFKVKDEGELHYILGLRIQRDRSKREIHISQKAYIETFLDEFEMRDCNPLSVPGLEIVAKPDDPANALLDDKMKTLYQSGIGKLNWLVRGSRPDLSFVLSILARHLQKPTMHHWKNLKRVLRYLKGTIDYGITLGKGTLVAYSDADFASIPDDKRRSTSGYIFHLGGPISWSSKRQSSPALSTTEAELMALVHAGKEALWLADLAREMGIEVPKIIPLKCDNRSTIAITQHAAYHSKTKHIDIKYHWLRFQIEENKFSVNYIRSEDQAADMLTKQLPPAVLHRNLMLNNIKIMENDTKKLDKEKRVKTCHP